MQCKLTDVCRLRSSVKAATWIRVLAPTLCHTGFRRIRTIVSKFLNCAFRTLMSSRSRFFVQSALTQMVRTSDKLTKE